MNLDEERIATALYAAMQEASQSTERADQDREFKVGVSSLGHCSELARRMIAGIEPSGSQDWLAAIIGTAVGDWIETHAVPKVWPDAITQAEVTVVLKGDQGIYHLPGHPDVIVPSEGLVLDNKGVNGFGFVRRNGPKQQQQFQRHCYAKGAWEAGMFPEHTLGEIRVGNVWHDRSAQEHSLHVQIEPYSEDVVKDATDWLDEVVYDYMHNQEARKEPHYAFCEGYCPHFEDCRLGESDVEGLIEDPEILSAVDMLMESKALASQANRLKNQAQIALHGIQGSTGTYTIRWTKVNGGEVAYYRESYEKLDIRKIK